MGCGEALDLIERERITSLYLAPTLYFDLVHHPRIDEADVSSVETLAYAGAAMASALVERCTDVFRPRLSSTTTARRRSTRSRSIETRSPSRAVPVGRL